MLSRLKGMETEMPFLCNSMIRACAHVLSRLKGMETVPFFWPSLIQDRCTCAFPFEGNGNHLALRLHQR